MYACLHAQGNLALLAECARQFSPLLEEVPPDAMLLDIRGLATLFGPAESIAQALHHRAGIPADIAIASNPDAALHAARGLRGITIIPAGREAQTLAPLPLNLLSGSPEIAAALDAWGIRTFGQFAALPPPGVAARLGTEGTYLQRLARGAGSRVIRPLADPTRFEEELELEHPVELMEPLSFLLARLLHQLCARLTADSLAADEIRLILTLEKAGPHFSTLRLPLPMRDPATFLKLLQLDLDAHPPGAPVLKIHLSLNSVEPRTQQHGLFVPLSPAPAKLEITLARLYHLLSAESVGTPELLDTHRPDTFQMGRFTATMTRGLAPPAATPSLALRRFRPRLYAQVRVQQGRPAYLSALAMRGEVVGCSGPWRSSGDWWKAEPWDHAEWDVELGGTGHYRIYEDMRTGRWFVAGTYD